MADIWLSVLKYLAIILYFTIPIAQCDVYMHNPRGSNNRLDGQRKNVRNANRLFNSQNNGKGGYNVGDFYHIRTGQQDLQYNMKYFSSGSKANSMPANGGKSLLVLQWTNQHGCGNEDLNCDIIIQYKCQDNVYGAINTLNPDTMRNGGSTGIPRYRKIKYSRRTDWRISKRKMKLRQTNMNTGLHESWEWYDKCNRRKRNGGLFTADQKLKKTTSISTRQNPQGTRYGYECPEERDYYPYWHPTDWKDIAVLANDEKRCQYYKKNSFNTNTKSECLDYITEKSIRTGFKHYSQYNNKAKCRGVWVEFTNFLEERPDFTTERECRQASTKDVPLVWGVPYVSEDVDALEYDPVTKAPKKSCLVQLPPVDCRKANYTRANHLGNAGNALAANYTWVLPYFPSNQEKRCVVRIRYNISTTDYDRDATFSDKNGDKSPVKNNPTVKATKFGVPLQLAVNTAQFGRTFQDRSHIYILKPREKSSIPDDVTVHNVNVRGKRGNIVQVYPAVEYDFTPNNLTISTKDYVHFQWTGSNNNPANNAGQGRRSTDRSNIVEIDEPGQNVKFAASHETFQGAKIIWSGSRYTKSADGLDVSLASAGFFSHVINGKLKKEDLGVRRKPRFQDELDNSLPSYPGLVLKMKKGVYHYMCTRNNNFSNRNQKASITVV